MYNPDLNASPFNSLPGVVVLISAAMAGVEVALALGEQGLAGGQAAVGWRISLIERLHVSGPLFDWMLRDLGRWTWDILIRFVAYPFVHVGFGHMLFAVVITLALGKFVGESFRPAALAAVWICSAILAAIAYAVITRSPVPLIGGMPPAYGMIGAFTFILWQRARSRGESPVLAFRMIGFLIALQLVFGAIGGGFGPHIVAELVGFASGFLVSFVVSPGGWTAVRQSLRHR